MVCTSTVENEEDLFLDVLPYEDASHNSVKIRIPEDDDSLSDCFQKGAFRDRLMASVTSFRNLNKSSVWIEIPMAKAGLIEEMQDTGFEFHHAQGHMATLNKWLRDDDCKIPEYATHRVGVGAVVVNSKNEILCVRELRGQNYLKWKVPGGLAELGEHINEAAIREIMEETAVPCKFVSVITFRHTHNLQFGRSDLYFMCRLEPIETMDSDGNAVIPDPVPQADEIEAAAWVPWQEYKEMVYGKNGHPMMQHIIQVFENEKDIQQTVIPSIVPGRTPAPIYHTPLGDEDSANS